MTSGMSLPDTVRQTLNTSGMAPYDQIWVCAVSGGADSTALIHLLAQLADGWRLRLVVAHLDHELRGADSRRDAEFVAETASALGLQVRIERAGRLPLPPPGLSPEARAREVRRRFLDDVRRVSGADRIALAHTLDDQAETILFRAVSGTSISGLSAMDPALDARWVRPLLGRRRAELRRWLRDHGIAWREDTTNRATDARRNRVRHDILPLVEHRLNPRAVEALGRLGDDAREVSRFVDQLAEIAYADCATESIEAGTIRLDSARLHAYDRLLRRLVIRQAFARLRGSARDLTREHVCRVDELTKRSGDLNLPGDIQASSEQGRLLFRSDPESVPSSLTCRDLGPPDVSLRFGTATIVVGTRAAAPDAIPTTPTDLGTCVAWFDASEIRLPLYIRPWSIGDRITPFGMSGRVKLSDLFGNAKIPRSDRPQIPIVADENGILWVAGVRRSDRAPVGPNTKRMLRVQLVPSEIGASDNSGESLG